MFKEIIQRIKYWHREDRISPENPLTHWRLYFTTTMRTLCAKRLKHFGEHAEVRPGAYIGNCSNVSIGARVVVRPLSILFASSPLDYAGKGSIIIEDGVLLGPAVSIYTNKHRFADAAVPIINQGTETGENVVIERGAWIGAGTIILPGVTVGRNAVIGAGSVVTKDIPEYTLAVGVPAKVIRHLSNTTL